MAETFGFSALANHQEANKMKTTTMRILRGVGVGAGVGTSLGLALNSLVLGIALGVGVSVAVGWGGVTRKLKA